jgi:hypothetical protein
MVSVNQLCNKLNEIGFRFKSEHPRTKLFRRGTERILVPKRAKLDDLTARSILLQAGCDAAAIDSFLRSSHS